jgi:poly(3-hydroxybutyrate) depolymerase
LQTIENVFMEHKLPKGEMIHRNVRVDPGKIHRVALMTVEGEKDDISGLGQTYAAQRLCKNLPDTMREHHEQVGAGHYGVFHGSRFRAEIAPKIRHFIGTHQRPQGVLARIFGRASKQRVRAREPVLL